MAKIDVIYANLSKAILDYGYIYKDESRGKNCKQISTATLSIPLTEFPLLTTKKMFTKGIVGELLWFLRGDSNIKYLNDNGIKIWDEDAKNFSKDGDVGRNYGVQWRDWTGRNKKGNVDQFVNLIDALKKKPIGRRHIVTAWNPAELNQTALPPCHWAFEVLPRPLFDHEKIALVKQSIILEKDFRPSELREYIKDVNNVPQYGFDLKWHQRSVDTFLGLPFNIASYALLAHIIGKLTNFVPLNIVGDLSNVHFYEPHIEVAVEQLQRDPNTHEGCNLLFSERFNDDVNKYHNGDISTNDFLKYLRIEDFIFDNYKSFDSLKAEMFAPTE